jgi:hypothetical protein
MRDKRPHNPLAMMLVLSLPAPVSAGQLEWIVVAPDGKGFVTDVSGTPFVPWGFNYDHDEAGRLIEDYWDTQFPKIEADFAEMKALGANIVRIHLQFAKFMTSASEPNRAALDRLHRLVKLAEAESLYLDLTGLGCYHKKDVPDWYDRLSESERWRAQGRFWAAVAQCCKDSPAIFCYDLMNEPVVPGGPGRRDDWLGPPFAGKHFVQFITLETKGRPRPEIARAWIDELVTIIRRHDSRHLITVGLVPWSLDRPGLTSGFVPSRIADKLDFLAVHVYPERDKVDEAVRTVAGFAVGKPIVVEEMFPLKCSADELWTFIDKSRAHARGWIGFYWGTTADECRRSAQISDHITLAWLELFERRAESMRSAK